MTSARCLPLDILIRHSRMALASLARAGSEIELLKSGRFGEVSVGAITGPALTLMPRTRF